MAQAVTIDGYPATRRYQSVEEAERENSGIAENVKWQRLVAEMIAGDELWLSSWGLDEDSLRGAEVLLLVRAGKVVGGLTLKIGIQ